MLRIGSVSPREPQKQRDNPIVWRCLDKRPLVHLSRPFIVRLRGGVRSNRPRWMMPVPSESVFNTRFAPAADIAIADAVNWAMRPSALFFALEIEVATALIITSNGTTILAADCAIVLALPASELPIAEKPAAANVTAPVRIAPPKELAGDVVVVWAIAAILAAALIFARPDVLVRPSPAAAVKPEMALKNTRSVVEFRALPLNATFAATAARPVADDIVRAVMEAFNRNGDRALAADMTRAVNPTAYAVSD